jgi:CheY-like chemotaxis protein
MPVMNGFSAAKYIRKKDNHITILALTAGSYPKIC